MLRQIFPGGQQNRGTVCSEYMHRNTIPSILVHTVGDAGNTLCQKDTSDKVYCSELNPKFTKRCSVFLMRPAVFFLKLPCSLKVYREHSIDKESCEYKRRHVVLESSSHSQRG